MNEILRPQSLPRDALSKKREATLNTYHKKEHSRSRSKVEHAVSERYIDTPENIRRRAEYLFGSPPEVELTQEECDDLQRLSEYVGKRLVHAEGYSPLFSGDRHASPADIDPLQDHDVTHAIV